MAFSNLAGFSDQALSVIVLVLCAGISAHFMYGFGTRKAKETFIGLILLLVIGLQLFYLIPAAITVPANRFYTWNVGLVSLFSASLCLAEGKMYVQPKYHRQDCLLSGKGGKRAKGERKSYDLNPCYCHKDATCKLINSGKCILADFPVIYPISLFPDSVYNSTNSSCPIDDNYECLDTVGNKVS
jgi:hypothetical protein